MTLRSYPIRLRLLTWLLAALPLFNAVAASAQDRFPSVPGYARYQEMSRKVREAVNQVTQTNVTGVAWAKDSMSFEYGSQGKIYLCEVATGKSTEIKERTLPLSQSQRTGRRSFAVERGRQVTTLASPDGQWTATYKEGNLWLGKPNTNDLTPITTEGNLAKRIKYGTGSWVYGEELNQNTAFWWSPDSKKIAFYRFDESKVKDYYLTLKTVEINTTLDVEPYPKAGADNPIVELFFYDLESKSRVQADIRDGKPFENDVVGYYVYNIRWSPDGKELLANRTNRKQNIMEVVAINPKSGKCRVIVREEWKASWVENHPMVQYLSDNNRFVFASERNGFRNFYLYDLSGKLHVALTQHKFEVGDVVQIDEKAGLLYYMARSGDTPYKLQLHRVGLDGKGDIRITDPTLHHDVQISPDGKWFIDRAESHKTAPSVRLLNMKVGVVSMLATSNTEPMKAVGITPPEMFTFIAADGATPCYGLLYKPTNFDPTKKYPVLMSVYGGPDSDMISESFMGMRFGAETTTELGFLVVKISGRGTKGRGKAFMDATYGKLGIVEIDDHAEAIKYLRQRPYVDGTKVGIHGVSYGGYTSALCILRHPDVFQAACAQSAVTDWRNYDTIYTERYMGLPQENKSGYDAGSAMRYVNQLKGRLMLFYGTADNNVHPANTHQLIQALQRAGRSFDLQIGPDQGHTGLGFARMMEFFHEALKITR